MKKNLMIVLLLPALLVSACDSAAPPAVPSPTPPAPLFYELQLAGQTFYVELANTPQLLRRGLAHRDHLDPHKGMLFAPLFSAPMAMWMKDCKIPLDVLFFDHQLVLINFHTMAVPDPALPDYALPRYSSDKPAKYALELPAGTAQGLGREPGQPLTFSTQLLKALAKPTE